MPPHTSAGLQEGVLEEWNDERGFGFIRPVAEGPRAFVHVSAFGRARRPVVGIRVAYAVGRDERGRARATEAHHLAADEDRVPAGLARALFVSLAFCVVLLALMALGRVPVLVPLAYAVLSAVAVLLFRTLFWCAVVANCAALAVFAYAGSDVVARIVGGA